MAAYDIQKHFKGLRADTGRRRGRDPFATGFEDDSDKGRSTKSKATTQKGEKSAAPTKPGTSSVASPFAQLDASLRDSDDDLLDAQARTDRRPSPASSHLPQSRLADGATKQRRGSLPGRTPRSAVALAAGDLAYLDESEDEEALTATRRTDRRPSPAPRRKSDRTDRSESASGSRGAREPPKEQSQTRVQPSRHTVASPFAGTKYLEDSETSDEEAISSRQGSTDSNAASPPPDAPDALSPYESALAPKHPEIKRVDKPKQNGSGVSWRAFSASRTEQRNAELEAIQASLRQRGKRIAFGTHAITDDGKKVPIARPTTEQIFAAGSGGGRGRARGRDKSPPRRAADLEPIEDELEAVSEQPIRRSRAFSDPDHGKRPAGAETRIPDIRIDHVTGTR